MSPKPAFMSFATWCALDDDKSAYANGIFYHQASNATYFMKNGTCIRIYAGFYRHTNGKNLWIIPKIAKNCPV